METIKIISDINNISLSTNDYSCLEISKFEDKNFKDYLLHLGVPEHNNLYWFNRIKVRQEGIGTGKLLMQKLCNLLDSLNIMLVCQINPYGKRNLEDLKRFYINSGFILISTEESLCYRLPKII